MPFKGRAAKSCSQKTQTGLIFLGPLRVPYFKGIYHTEETFKNIQVYVLNHSFC